MKKKKGVTQHTPKSKQSNNIKLGKEDSMLHHFAQGKRLHRFQAEHLGDHCLHTTVSDLQSKYVIFFDRVRVKVPNRFGTLTSVTKYWLTGDNLLKAQKRFGLGSKEVA